jgi:hypothetical protein
MIAHEQDEALSAGRRVRDLLLTHLQSAAAPPWPGGDGITLEEILRSYPEAAALGLVPDLETLTQQHPDLAQPLRDYFAG